MTLKDFGYPEGYIIDTDTGGGNGQEYPQEALSSYTCNYCRKFDKKEWVCTETGKDVPNPDCETCENIDYIEEWLDSQFGFRPPVRSEYCSDKAFNDACNAIKAINKSIQEEYENER